MTTLDSLRYQKMAEKITEKMPNKLKEHMYQTKVGRPSKFDPKMCDVVEAMCLKGKSKAQICRELRISTTTYDDWIRNGKDVQFSATHKQGQADRRAFWDDLRDDNLDNPDFNWQWHEQHYKRQYNSAEEPFIDVPGFDPDKDYKFNVRMVLKSVFVDKLNTDKQGDRMISMLQKAYNIAVVEGVREQIADMKEEVKGME